MPNTKFNKAAYFEKKYTICICHIKNNAKLKLFWQPMKSTDTYRLPNSTVFVEIEVHEQTIPGAILAMHT